MYDYEGLTGKLDETLKGLEVAVQRKNKPAINSGVTIARHLN